MIRYVDDNLNKNEKVILRGKVHWGTMIIPGALILAIIILISSWAGLIRGSGVAESVEVFNIEVFNVNALIAITKPILYLPFIIILIMGAGRLAGMFIAEFAVTNKRVILKTGVFRSLVMETPLNKINNIVIEQSLLGRLLNYGTVYIHITGGYFNFPYLVEPHVMKNIINMEMEEYQDEKFIEQISRLATGDRAPRLLQNILGAQRAETELIGSGDSTPKFTSEKGIRGTKAE